VPGWGGGGLRLMARPPCVTGVASGDRAANGPLAALYSASAHLRPIRRPGELRVGAIRLSSYPPETRKSLDLNLPHPLPQRLRRTATLRGDGPHRRPLGAVLAPVLEKQPHGSRADLPREPARPCHDPDPPKERGLRPTRGGSPVLGAPLPAAGSALAKSQGGSWPWAVTAPVTGGGSGIGRGEASESSLSRKRIATKRDEHETIGRGGSVPKREVSGEGMLEPS